ncbi:DMT family transporter [Rhizobium sp. BK181]|uniref:DMT family transporter n=1 Tax=Rhizobium sp. BK181 TaxID=2587072 RepID=UPI00161187F8|nr:DMT family transporter [Rhizobium sp. BK181]
MTLDRFAPAIFVFLWSTGWIIAKYASLHSEPFSFLVIRYALSAVVFCAISLAIRAKWPKGALAWRAIYSGIFLHGFYLGGVWWAVAHGVPAGISGIIAAMQPLLTALAANAIIGERLRSSQTAGLALGFVGIALAISPKLMQPGTSDLLHAGIPLAVNLAAMFAVTFGTIYQKKHLQNGDLTAIATLQYLGALGLTAPFALVFETFRFDGTLETYAALAWSVFGISVGGIALLLYLIRRGQVSRAASLIYLCPPTVAIQALVAFGEPLTPLLIVGTMIVAVGVYLTNRKARLVAKA